MSSTSLRRLLLLALTGFCFAGFPLHAQDDPLASGALQIQGSRLTLYADAETTDADQTINVGERAQIRTCFGGSGATCGVVQPGDPRTAGLKVLAELSGPELPQAVPLETVPGGTFLVPGFQQEGEYYVENIRLVSEATGEVLSFSQPSLAILHVRQIVLTSASVRTLTLEEMRARGITFSEENFQAYDFAVGFAIGSEFVEIRFPIVYTGDGQALPLTKPKVMLDGLPPDVIATVARWKPPNIIPFKLAPKDDGEGLKIGEEEDQELIFPVFGAIVIPGTLTYLNQFFDASLIVANGAGPGSNVRLENLRGKIRLPPANVLRLAQTSPPVSLGQDVPVLESSGGTVLFPGEQGQATWTLEGLRPGTHTVTMDLEGDIARPGRENLPVLTRVQAAVEVVDARFNVTFSHPDVVREGEEYTLFVTVSNQSQAAQNLVKVKIRAESMTGAHKADPNDPLERLIETLAPGQSQTVEFDLVSELTGKVAATTFQSDNQNLIGTIELRTGVGELGIPLSPATLIMPRYTEFLQPPYTHTTELVKAHVRLFGLAYSLAVAPSAFLPPGLPSLVKDDVETRAIDLAEAGQRLYLQDEILPSLEVLALDQQGNSTALSGFDELRRRTNKGLRAAAQIAEFWRREQGDLGLDAVELFDQFADTTSYSRPFLAVMAIPQGTGGLKLEITSSKGILSGVADEESAAARSLPWGEVYAVRRTAGLDEERAPFAVVGRVEQSDAFKVRLVNPESQPLATRLYLMVPEGATGYFRRVDFGTVTVAALSTLEADISAATGNNSFQLRDAATLVPYGAPANAQRMTLPPFRIVGSHQEPRLDEKGPDTFGNYYRPNRHGNGMTYLFNRPPVEEDAETASFWRIISTFDGLTDAELPVLASATKTGLTAWLQPNSERVVNVRYDGLVGAQINAETQAPLLEHEHQIAAGSIHDLFGNTLQTNVPPPVVETIPLHTGGLVGGRVVRGTGEGVVGAKVELIRPRVYFTALDEIIKNDLIATTTTGADGRFFFEYIEERHWDFQVAAVGNFVLRATVPEGDDPELEPAEAQEISATIRRQNRMATINIALLGRGAVQGKLVYLDTQLPVPEGTVRAASTLFSEQKSVRIEADGTFRIPGMPVGPITLTGSDQQGRKVYATVGIERPGATVDVYLELQRQQPNTGKGTVRGTVLRQRSGEAAVPAAGARIAVYSDGHPIDGGTTAADGTFEFTDVPSGRVSLQAADWRISRASSVVDLTLADGETRYIELKLTDGGTRVVSGQVLFRDPITSTLLPVEGAVAFIKGPGNFAYTDATGTYRIEGVPVQAAGSTYEVTVIDFQRQYEGRVALPPILEVSPEVIGAQPLIIQSMRGRVEGVVYDPLGRPAGNVPVVLYPYAEGQTQADGSFAFEDVPLGHYEVVAHNGDGLQPGKVGYFGKSATQVVYGGHSPFVRVRMVGGGIVRVRTRTATSTGILTPIYYKPTYYSTAAKNIVLRGAYTETSTDPNGFFEVALPVGSFEIVAYNPFHGIKNINAEIEYAGQILDYDVVFQNAGKVRGVVVDVDGVTPVADVEVTLKTKAFQPQTLRSGPTGEFLFELVPQGTVEVEARGYVGNVQRVGKTFTLVTLGGQDVDIVVQMKKQGTVRGQVLELYNGVLRPLPYAQYYVSENSFPFRRIPDEGVFRTTDADGYYEVSGLYAGRVEIVARDSTQTTRRGKANATIVDDWSLVEAPDIVMQTSVGTLRILMRDPTTGAGVPDALIRLGASTWTVTGSDGVAIFESLALGTYDVYAFNAPTGQSGRLKNVRLENAGEIREATVYLDVRGEVDGYLLDTADPRVPVFGGTVSLSGFSAGGNISALATSSGRPDQLGYFSFGGIPEGTYSLQAAAPGSVRRGSASVGLTETAPRQTIEIVLEPVLDAHFRLYEKLRAGDSPVDTSLGVFSLRLTQPSHVPYQVAYDFTQLDPDPATHTYFFQNLLAQRGLSIAAREAGGEQRRRDYGLSQLPGNTTLAGDGSAADPYRVVLGAKGAVQITVRDAANQPVPFANITLSTAGGQLPLVAGDDGAIVWNAVAAGNVSATARHPLTGTAGRADGQIVYDDDVLYLLVQLAPSVSARGVIYQPVPGDVWDGVTPLLPKDGALVELRDGAGATQIRITGADGAYRFDALTAGNYSLTARNNNLDELATRAGILNLPNGTLNEIPPLILDASPPRIVQITPAPGLDNVSRLATVEILFSEPLLGAVLPGAGGNGYFRLRASNNQTPAGAWSHHLLPDGLQVVRFTPSAPYLNLTTYSLTITGGTGGVRDLMGRPLTNSGNVGANFKTSDSVGPAVLTTEPRLDRPLPPDTPVRVDFSEKVTLPPGGIGVVATWEVEANGQWFSVPISTILTRSDYSLLVTPLSGFNVPGASLRRRLTVDQLLDASGNAMSSPYVVDFRLWDSNVPTLAVDPPAGVVNGELYSGGKYLVVPQLGNLDDLPQGDIDKVEYFYGDPNDPVVPAITAFTATTAPYQYNFTAPAQASGGNARPFPIYVRATDTSTNKSNVVFLDLEILPNAAPTLAEVNVQVTGPVVGTFYAGSKITVTLIGIDDPDGNTLTAQVDLRRSDGVGLSIPGSPSSKTLSKGAGTWPEVTPPQFTFVLPQSWEEGTQFYFHGSVRDSQNIVAFTDSSTLPVADDATDAQIVSFAAKKSGVPALQFFIGEKLQFEVLARDFETAIKAVNIEIDRSDIFPALVATTTATGSNAGYVFTSAEIPVLPDLFTERTPIVATAVVEDYGGNITRMPIDFDVTPSPDPTAPQATWLTPWQNSEWPALYQSVLARSFTPWLLRAFVSDTTLDDDGIEVPGNIVSVTFRGPVVDAEGVVRLAETWLPAVRVDSSGPVSEGLYQLVWQMPGNLPEGAVLPFAIRAVDSGGKDTVQVVSATAVKARRVYEGVQTAIDPGDEMFLPEGDAAGPVFLLDNSRVAIEARPTPLPIRELPALYIYAGGRVEANGSTTVHPSTLLASEITTYDSVIKYRPLELAVERVLGVGHGCAVDLTARGLLGGTANRQMLLPGQIGSGALAGGSHGGSGWAGLVSGNWSSGTFAAAGEVYDNLLHPYLPGGGGRSNNSSSSDPTKGGGTGGGVVYFSMPNAVLHLAGDLLARGGSSSVSPGGGGAGGTIDLTVLRIEGDGLIDASGSTGTSATSTGGGGGGRVAIRYAELGDFDIALQVKVEGGATASSGGQRRGGAGTLWLEQVGALGSLVVKNPNDLAASATPLPALGEGNVAEVDVDNAQLILPVGKLRGDVGGHTLYLNGGDGSALGSFPIVRQSGGSLAPIDGDSRIRLSVAATPEELLPIAAALASNPPLVYSGELRLAEVEASGKVQLIADDGLLLGAGDDPLPTLNDRSRIHLDGDARVALSGEVPVLELTSSVPDGETLRQLATTTVGWTVTDQYGLAKVTERWTLNAAPLVRTYSGELSAAPASRTLTISGGTPPGTVVYEVEVENQAGRRTTLRRTWTVVANTPPSAVVSWDPASVKAGYSLVLQILATDAEGLASLTWTASGPIKPGSNGQTQTLSGTSVSRSFQIDTLASASGSTPITLSGSLTDNLGSTIGFGPFTVPVLANDAPSGTLDLAAGAPAEIKPSRSTTVLVHAEDFDGISQIELRATGEVTVPVQARTFANAPLVDATFTLTAKSNAQGGPLEVRAVLTDRFGATFETAPLALTIVADELPIGEVHLPEGAETSRLPGETVLFEYSAEDTEGMVEVIFIGSTSQGVTRTTLPLTGNTLTGSRSILVPLSAPANSEVRAQLEMRDTFGHVVTTPPAIVTVAADGDVPFVNVEGVASLYQSGENLSATITSGDNVAVVRLEIDFDGQTTTVDNPPASYNFTAQIPSLAAIRQTIFLVRAYDFGGNVGASAPFAVTLTPDPPPSLTIVPAAPFDLAPGQPLEVVATATDGQGLAALRMVLTGAVTATIERGASGLGAVETFRYLVPAGLPAGARIVIAVEVQDSFGNVVTKTTEATLLADTDDPIVSLSFSPQAAESTYVSGDAVDLIAIAGDNVAIDRLTLSVDAQTLATAFGGAPILFTYTVPTVDEPTTLLVEAEAIDFAGNLARTSKQLHVTPLANAGKPVVAFDCLSSGAILPAGYNLTLNLLASDDLGVERIEVFEGGASTPFATFTPAGGGTATPLAGSTSFALPSPAGAFADTTLRAVAYDASGNAGEQTLLVRSVPTVDLDAGGNNDWNSLAGENVVLRSGTLTIAESLYQDYQLSFDHLIVLAGATLTHAAAGTSSTLHGLEIGLTGSLYVACGGSINAIGRGYSGGYPGAGSVSGGAGGSHLGVGGNSGALPAHGSLYRPGEAGGGSGTGERGGGVIEISAASVLVDGTIRASGATGSRGPAGGSIHIVAAANIGGLGAIDANGGNATSSTVGSGGGGAVALEFSGALDQGLLSRTRATAGAGTYLGGAGTVFVKGPGNFFGDLRIDGVASGSPANTQLPSLGSGVAALGSAAGRLETGRSSIESYFVGHYLEVYGADGNSKSRQRITQITGGSLELELVDGAATIEPGDSWQGVYLFDRLSFKGIAPFESTDPVRALASEIDGQATLSRLTAGDLILRRSAVLRTTAGNASTVRQLDLDLSGDLILEPGAMIDLNGLGYPAGFTHPFVGGPDGSGGGSHLGRGGYNSGSSYGSVYRPEEAGAGSGSGGQGGGLLRLRARNVVLLANNSVIRANGQTASRGAAGGSIWMSLQGSLSGNGAIEAKGGNATSGSVGGGGGGAVAIEYGTTLDPSVVFHLTGGTATANGGAGTLYLFGPSSTYGDLLIDNGTVSGAATDLPSFGQGTALAGSSGSTLFTAKGSIAPYFVGHWIEITDGNSGGFEGSFRIAQIQGSAVLLEAEAGGPAPDIEPGDLYTAVYRFDNYEVVGSVPVQSVDPIRVGGVQEITGNVELREVIAHHLVLKSGAKLSHPSATSSGSPGQLLIRLTGDLTIESGASIDVSVRGYAVGVTYPGTSTPDGGSGGSHIGFGGTTGTAGSTFGSVYRPVENGGGSGSGGRGGGSVRIEARDVRIDGRILANGESASRGAAGGSVWISASGHVEGAGSIEARGGAATSGSSGYGGGGAIAVEYQSASGSVLSNLDASGGGFSNSAYNGGAGSLLLRSAADAYGRLFLDSSAWTAKTTRLPPLGGGKALPGSGGNLLVTDLTSIAAYFVGHWVEIYGPAGSLEGTYRVKSIAGGMLTLEAYSGAPPEVDAGDEWQGVYLFDELDSRGALRLDSADPVIVLGAERVLGNLTTRQILAGDLTLTSGAKLQHPATSGSKTEELAIDLTGDLTLEAGATIDVTALGYAPGVRYPGASAPDGSAGGSHLGRGGGASGSTYGSVYRPAENGGGSGSGGSGGGGVRIKARNVRIDGAILAKGETQSRGGGGGSVQIVATGELLGEGSIEVQGGTATSGSVGGGGGGAIALYYDTSGGSLLDRLRAYGGSGSSPGGPGTVYRFGSSSVYGDLLIDAGSVVGASTSLPSLGVGIAMDGTADNVLETGSAGTIPAYFVGHWVELTDNQGQSVDTWRIGAIDGSKLVLAPNFAGEVLSLLPGMSWQGVYRFDNLVTRGQVTLTSVDPIRLTQAQVIDGPLITNRIVSNTLVIGPTGRLSHPSGSQLEIELTGDLIIEPGGTIDVSNLGYAAGQSYPGASVAPGGAGGSHMGGGGNGSGGSFGSVYQPLEKGAGSGSSGRGGGSVRISARNVVIDGSIRANGETQSRGGAGGSVWIAASGTFSGEGAIEVQGGNATSGTVGGGGGGAISVEYLSGTGGVFDHLRAFGGSGSYPGGPGTVLLKSSTGTFGDLLVDAGTVNGTSINLPSLGSGVAGAATSGASLDVMAAKPAYFAGHWVEVKSAAGAAKGIWRVQAIVGTSLVLAPNAGETLTLLPGDLWQGIYRFDNFETRGLVDLVSNDPLRVSDQQNIAGSTIARKIEAGNLTIRSTGRLSHPSGGGLEIELSGDLTIESGGSLDVSSLGYAAGVSYPSSSVSPGGAGGSHLGRGGNSGGDSYGSVYEPRESGGGSGSGGAGGGHVAISARNVVIDGSVLAKGQTASRGAAGGSVWIKASGSFGGEGSIDVSGGAATSSTVGGGGGGAITIEYATGSGAILGQLRAFGGGGTFPAGPGTVLLKSAAGTYGDLLIDAGSVDGASIDLPALGAGVAGPGTTSTLLDIGQTAADYFVGHWVEVSSSAGVVKGIWRVAKGVGTLVELAPNGAETIELTTGDLWQGVYRFDNLTSRGIVTLNSDDPVRVEGLELIEGVTTTRLIAAGELQVGPSGFLLHPVGSSLRVFLTGDLTVATGGKIDVSSLGYAAGATYPNETASPGGSGGSHLGRGGNSGGSSFGSIYQPFERGGGSGSGGRGGGALHIAANNVVVDGLILANGQTSSRGGAGGSIWIEANGSLSGDGTIEARGGAATSSGVGAGGGGAISLSYQTSSGALLTQLNATGGGGSLVGGAGTIWQHSAASTYGDLLIGGYAGARTDAPGMGSGAAQAGTTGATLVTSTTTNTPAYFVGHWVEVKESAGGPVKGIWRIAKVNGLSVELAPNGGETIQLDEDDTWRGIYRFDSVQLLGNPLVNWLDPLEVGTPVTQAVTFIQEP